MLDRLDGFMWKCEISCLLCLTVYPFADLSSVVAQQTQPEQRVLPLLCMRVGCPLLQGVPQSEDMRSGLVRLEPSEGVGWHATAITESH